MSLNDDAIDIAERYLKERRKPSEYIDAIDPLGELSEQERKYSSEIYRAIAFLRQSETTTAEIAELLNQAYTRLTELDGYRAEIANSVVGIEAAFSGREHKRTEN